MIRTRFCLYDFDSFLLTQFSQYFPMSVFIWLYITILLYFGANTT